MTRARGDIDAVVVGSGPNGLVAANVLADAGWSVLVLEASADPGGSVRSRELIEPGFTNDLCSAFYPLAGAGSPIGALRLEEHGLRWRHAPAVLAHPSLDGSCPVVHRDVEATAATLDAATPGDGDAWRSLYDRWLELSPALDKLLFRPMPPVAGVAGLLRRVPPRELARLARFLLLPVRRLGEEHFDGEPARRLLAGAALHADLSPEASLSGFYGWLLCSLGQQHGFPVPEGGAGALTRALVDRLRSSGGELVCDAPVTEVHVRHGRAVGVAIRGIGDIRAATVVADVPAPHLYTSLVAAEHLPSGVLGDIARFHWDDATFKVDWTLDGPIPWTSAGARSAGTVHVAEGVDALTVAASELARGLIPARPFLLVGQQAAADPSRQPAGCESAWAYTHVPRHVRGDGAGDLGARWGPADVEGFAARIEAQVEALAPGFGALVRGRHILTPSGLEDENPSLSRGAINGGTAQLHQQLVFRPVPGLGRATTPIRGLYLASSSAHPGGGVHGAPGANAARAALAHRPASWLGAQLRRRGALPWAR